MVNPRSAITISPGRSLTKKPQFSVTNLLETRPPQASETKEIIPCGVNPTIILWCCGVYSWKMFGNELLKTVNDNSCVLAKGISETLGHCLPKLIPVWPENKGK